MPRTPETSPSPDKYKAAFLSDTAVELIEFYTQPRTQLGFDRFAGYKDEYGEWLIGYGSRKLGKSNVWCFTRASRKEIHDQLIRDLEVFAKLVEHYVVMPLNEKKRAAVLSYAHSIGLAAFKECRLLELINSRASKTRIIKEWSPYINRKDLHPEHLRNRRRAELNTFLAPDKTVPLFVEHKCPLKFCLLNIGETYVGTPNQVKAIEYFEKKVAAWDQDGEVMRRFWRYWSQPQGQTGSPKNI